MEEWLQVKEWSLKLTPSQLGLSRANTSHLLSLLHSGMTGPPHRSTHGKQHPPVSLQHALPGLFCQLLLCSAEHSPFLAGLQGPVRGTATPQLCVAIQPPGASIYTQPLSQLQMETLLDLRWGKASSKTGHFPQYKEHLDSS